MVQCSKRLCKSDGRNGSSAPPISLPWCEMRLTASLLVCLASGVASLDASDDDMINTIVKRLAEVDDPSEYPRLYRSLFSAAGADGLARLQTLPHDSVAIQSAWEAVTLTVPIESGNAVYRPDARKLNWFLGFLQGRARVSLPDWWRDVVLDVRAHRRDNFYVGLPKADPYRRTDVHSVTCPRNASVKKSGNSLLYQVGRDKITIPEELLDYYRDDYGELSCRISGCFTDKHCYLAIHDDAGYPHAVASVDRSSGDVIWKTKACGCWFWGTTGIHESWVSVVHTADDRVFVFGAASAGFYAHGFRASDGRSLMHFANNY